MAPDTPCPSPELLGRSLDPDDPMPGEQRQLIEEHVDRCDSGCKPMIEALLRGNTLMLGQCDTPPPQEARMPTVPVRDEPLPVIPGYEILGELGRGGMGVVYRARQLALDRVVALKMLLRPVDEAEAEEYARFTREALAVASLNHPGIVHIYELGRHGDRPFIAMELVEGENLAERLAGMPQPPQQAAALVARLAEAVQAAHSHQIVHRDLKPANVLLASDGTTKITDFGLAKRLGIESAESVGRFLGTPSYAAPEQASEHMDQVSPATDLYGLGAILYEMLTGRPPFRAATLWETLRQVVSTEPVPPSRLAVVPLDLETICLKCLHKEPSRRYATAAGLADELRRFLTGRPIHARPVGRAERLWRWGRRNPIMAGMIGLASAATAAVVLVSVLFALHQSHAADTLRDEQQLTTIARNKAEDLVDELRETDRRRRRFTQLSARLHLKEGQSQCEQGNVAQGMLFLARGLEITPDDESELAAGFRTNLDAWRRRLHPLRAVLPHRELAGPTAFSPDGKKILTGSNDKTARLWDAATGRPIGRPMLHDDFVRVVAFSPDGRTVLTGSHDKTARLWDAATGEPHAPKFVFHTKWVVAVAYSPDGKTILTGGYDGKARLWDVKTNLPIGQVMDHDGLIRIGIFSPDGKTVLTAGDDGKARLWDAATGQSRGIVLPHEAGIIRAAAFSPDGATVLTGGSDKTARLWDITTGKQASVLRLEHDAEVWLAIFSADGRSVLTAGGRKAKLWGTATGELLHTHQHQDDITSLAISPDGRTALTGSLDHTAVLWYTGTGKPVGSPLRHRGWIRQAIFSPDGRSVLTSSADGTARLWDVEDRPDPLIYPHASDVGPVAYSPDSKTIVTGSWKGSVQRWDPTKVEPLGDPAHPMLHDKRVNALAYSPDGKTLLTAGHDGKAKFWDAETGRETGIVLEEEDATIWAVAFSPDGRTVLTGAQLRTTDTEKIGKAQLWDAATGQRRGEPLWQPGAVWCVAFSPDGKMAAMAGYGSAGVRLWDVRAGKDGVRFLPHPSYVWGLSFSPDGKTLVAGCWDRTAWRWDRATNRPILPALHHRDWLYGVAISSDGRHILTGSKDATARLWDAASGQPVGPPLLHDSEVLSVAFSPDGRTMLTGSRDKTARLWRRPAPMKGTAEQIVLWAQVATGMELNDDGVVRGLDEEVWAERRRRLEESGG